MKLQATTNSAQLQLHLNLQSPSPSPSASHTPYLPLSASTYLFCLKENNTQFWNHVSNVHGEPSVVLICPAAAAATESHNLIIN